jgi:hypothetical protein
VDHPLPIIFDFFASQKNEGKVKKKGKERKGKKEKKKGKKKGNGRLVWFGGIPTRVVPPDRETPFSYLRRHPFSLHTPRSSTLHALPPVRASA